MKRIFGLILTLIMVVSLAGTSVYAGDLPSDWAVEEVQAAIDGGLVPKDLRLDYQATITRAEYVLLALEVLEDAGVKTDIVYRFPFDDINGHIYESEIVKGFNAKLISGYQDGSFRPDAYISRQEIATLIVNLVKALDSDEVITQETEFIYSDDNEIGAWARTNIDYCFANGLLRGVGRDQMLRQIIDPRGNTTVEQAILLILRLASSKDVYEVQKYTSLDYSVDDRFTENDPVETFDEFARAVGGTTADRLYDLQNRSYASIISLTDSYIEIRYFDGSDISIAVGASNEIRLELTDPDNALLIGEFSRLVFERFNGYDSDVEVRSALMKFERDLSYTYSNDISENAELNIYSFNPGDNEATTIYVVQAVNNLIEE